MAIKYKLDAKLRMKRGGEEEKQLQEVVPEQRGEESALEQRTANEDPEKSLEEVVGEQGAYPSEQMMELSAFTQRFSYRYKHEERFREIVHKELKIGSAKEMGLKLAKFLRPSWYQQKTDALIAEYASQFFYQEI